MDPVKNILGNKKAKEPIEAYCFECGQMIEEKYWIKKPISTYGCDRHL